MFEVKNSHKYDDIIHLSYPEDVKHNRKSTVDRAAQFSPFAALTGYDAAIDETARQTDEKIELDENEKAILNEKMRRFQELQLDSPVTITFYRPDERKEGGAYLTEVDHVKKFENFPGAILLQNGLRIAIEDIIAFEFDEKR